jgi:peptidoglycan hydrolase-like protein with peptidoglycan-binding domain
MPKNTLENDINPLLVRGAGRALIAAGATLAAGASLAATANSAVAAPMRANGSTAQSAVVPSPEYLSAGATGAAVKQLQGALQVRVDGSFGSATRAAVIRFQRQHHLTVDGVVGPQTRRALHLRVRIVQASAPASHAVSSTAPASTGTSSGYAIPASIVMCESGGNWGAVNPTTGAGGAYQIMPSTWAAYGGTGMPQDASPAEQSAIAAKIWASSGPGAWSC